LTLVENSDALLHFLRFWDFRWWINLGN